MRTIAIVCQLPSLIEVVPASVNRLPCVSCIVNTGLPAESSSVQFGSLGSVPMMTPVVEVVCIEISMVKLSVWLNCRP